MATALQRQRPQRLGNIHVDTDPAWDVPGIKRDEKGEYVEPVGKNKDPLKVFVIENVDGQPAIHISGQGFGVMTTLESFDNFHLRLQIKWGEKRAVRRFEYSDLR